MSRSSRGGAAEDDEDEVSLAIRQREREREVNEPSEADRALTVVEKKLGKSLSVEAQVNELIVQASDEKNLAVLYCGWGAYV